jgi:hypothetical protein
LYGRHEIVLDDHQIADIGAVNLTQVRMPPHTELCFQLQAESRAALRGGETVPPFDAIETNSLTVFAGKTSGCEPLRPLAAVGGQIEGGLQQAPGAEPAAGERAFAGPERRLIQIGKP